eukprot:1982592-Pleurochrysis_carterae.AAC.2
MGQAARDGRSVALPEREQLGAPVRCIRHVARQVARQLEGDGACARAPALKRKAMDGRYSIIERLPDVLRCAWRDLPP